MNWRSAKNLCAVHGLNLFIVEDIDCYFDNDQKVTAGSGKTVYRCRKNESCAKNDWGNTDEIHLFSQEIIDICQNYPNPFYPWLASQHNGADNHVDLYHKTDVIPFKKIADFFKENLNNYQYDFSISLNK